MTEVEVKVRRKKQPEPPKDFIDWTAYSIEDWFNNLGDLGRSLGDGDINQSIRESVRLYSIKRWAWLLPGGGRLRGGKVTRRPNPQAAAVPPAAPSPAPASASRKR